MRKYSIFLYMIFLVGLGCTNPKNKELKNKLPKKTNTVKSKDQIVIKEEIPKDPDSINNRNTVAFLTKYGTLNKETTLLIETRLGNIKIKLFKDTPLHRASFIFLSKVGYFDTTCFYRVVPNFIIQGGNSERMTTIRYRNKYKHYKIPAEFTKHKHHYGAIAAARDWDNNPRKRSTPFEFYIVQNKKGAYHLDGEHTVFGEVISGFSVIDKIVELKAGNDEWPLEDAFIKTKILF